MDLVNRQLRIGLAQINPTVGDLDGNVKKIYRDVDVSKHASEVLAVASGRQTAAETLADSLLKIPAVDKKVGRTARDTPLLYVLRDDLGFAADAIERVGAEPATKHHLHVIKRRVGESLGRDGHDPGARRSGPYALQIARPVAGG